MRISRKTFVLTLTALAALSVALCSGAAMAEKLKKPTVEYSADQHIDAGGTTLAGKVYNAPGKQRIDQDAAGMKRTFISRDDKGLVWILMPASRIYMESPITEGAPGAEGVGGGSFEYDYTDVGKETVNGIKTTKRKISGKGEDGSEISGFLWITSDGIVVKMDLSARGGEGGGGRVIMELKNLKVEKQDPALFEVPEGYRRLEMGGMGMPGK